VYLVASGVPSHAIAAHIYARNEAHQILRLDEHTHGTPHHVQTVKAEAQALVARHNGHATQGFLRAN
jgi:hypothetical protein